MTDWIVWGPAGLIGLPLAGLFACLAMPRAGHAVAMATSVLQFGLVVAIGVGGGIGTTIALGGWAAPLGIALRLDALAWAFVAVTAFVFALATPSARTILGHEGVPALWLGLLTGMSALFVSGDLFNLFVAIEIASLSAVALTAVGGERKAARAAFGYLCVSLTGGLLFLAGVALLYRATGSLDIAQVGALVREAEPSGLIAALGLASAGLLLKTGAFPMHVWLPPTHGAATSTVSAVLSGVVVKGSLFILVRLWSELAPDALWAVAGHGLAALGVAGAAIGTLGAFQARRLKQMIAYSTVAQIGYMVLAFGISAAEPRAMAAMVAFVAGHALAKAALFIAAGEMVRANGHDDIDRLVGPGAEWGPTSGAIAIAAATLIGLPPTGGFAAKWTLAQAGLSSGFVWVPVFLVLGGLATAAYMSRLAAALMRSGPVTVPAHDPAPGRGLHGWASFGLALAALSLGFAVRPIVAAFGGGA